MISIAADTTIVDLCDLELHMYLVNIFYLPIYLSYSSVNNSYQIEKMSSSPTQQENTSSFDSALAPLPASSPSPAPSPFAKPVCK